jgi:adenosyl cobinamide kinase/adenosyl cobinamide phosphate guanylyltransferase
VIILVLGGTRSGKSAVAERVAARFGASVTYVATAPVDPDDHEMATRIAAHRARRPPTWTTVEAGAGLVDAVRGHLDGPMLVDALGAWVAGCDDLVVDLDGLLAALRGRSGPTVVVSEEVGLSVHPVSAVGRAFIDVMGDVNRLVADIADEVLLVVAGRVVPLPALTDP